MEVWFWPTLLVIGITIPVCCVVAWIAWLGHREDMERLRLKAKDAKGKIGFM